MIGRHDSSLLAASGLSLPGGVYLLQDFRTALRALSKNVAVERWSERERAIGQKPGFLEGKVSTAFANIFHLH